MTDAWVTTGTARSAVAGSTATVEIGTITVTAQVVRGLTLADRDPVVLVRSRAGSQWWVVGRLGSATPDAAGEVGDPVDNPRSSLVTGRLVIPPVDTGSWTGSSWRTDTDDPHQGTYGGWGNHTGTAFYGSSLPASLAGATVTAAAIYLRRGGEGDPDAKQLTLRLVTEATRPAGAPTLGASTTGPSLTAGAETLFPLPTAWAQAIVDGTAGGIGCYVAGGTPYIRTAGRSTWGAAWTMLIDWSR